MLRLARGILVERHYRGACLTLAGNSWLVDESCARLIEAIQWDGALPNDRDYTLTVELFIRRGWLTQ